MNSSSKKITELAQLNTEKWRWFNCADLFKITGTKSFTKTDIETYGAGVYPYVCTSAANNGIDGLYDNFTEEGNVITVDSATIGSVFFQRRKFSASDHVEKLIPKFKINTCIAMFLCTILNLEKFRYSYGRKFSQTRIKETQIKLPADNNSKPDWPFMENYIKSISKKVDFSNSIGNIDNIKNVSVSLTKRNWNYFLCSDIFTCIRGKRLIKLDQIKGEVAYISSTRENNSIDNFIDPPEYMAIHKNALTLNNSGSVGHCFYHDYPFVASDHCTVIKIKDKSIVMNKYIAMFLKTIIEAIRHKYNFAREISDARLEKENFKLPTDNNGNPDWQFMENYIKSLPYSEHL